MNAIIGLIVLSPLILLLPRKGYVSPPLAYKHPSFRPTQSEFVSQPPPSNNAYRGPTAIRTKPNRHNQKRNKA